MCSLGNVGEMGSSVGTDGAIGMDCTVGTIVWVRRRNGSWWPGRILGQHELSASHLMSPRSGTPVKLLGREDASVDWYNLEKSKRVKPFRCGEFDACIERAEAAQGAPIKKREKYARREDAILHALELEKQQLLRMQDKSGTISNNPNNFGALKKELVNNSSLELLPTNDACMDHGKPVSSKSPPHLIVSSENHVGSSPSHAEKSRNGKEMSGEDENSNTIPRMRGLQDFGLRIAPKRKVGSSPLVSERTWHPMSDGHVDLFHDSWHGTGSVNRIGSGKNSPAKRKRSQSSFVEDSLVKRRDRRRPLHQVLKSSAKVPVMHSLQATCEPSFGLAKEKEHIGVPNYAEKRCMHFPVESGDVLDDNENSLDQIQMSPMHVCASGLHQIGPLPSEDTPSGLLREDETSSSEGEHVDTDTEEVATEIEDSELRHDGDASSLLENDSALGNFNNALLPNCYDNILSNDEIAGTGDVGVSKWHMKGKRNIRNLTRRTMDLFDGKVPLMVSDTYDGSADGIGYGKRRSAFQMGREKIPRQGNYEKNEFNFANEDEIIDKKIGKKLMGFSKQRYPPILKSAIRDHKIDIINYSDEESREMLASGWEADETCHLNQRRYWIESDDCMDPLFDHSFTVDKNFPLVDVDLKVQATYQGERVPLVSLMSKLNGKAIIGHPILVEILEDGSSDAMLPKNFLGMGAIGNDEHAAHPVWRTGRRTAMQRVPRTDLAQSTLEGDETEFDFFLDEKPLFKVPCSPIGPRSARSSSHHGRPTKGKSNKKLKKGNLSSQKTRTLSSLVTEHKRTGASRRSKQGRKDSSILGGLIRPGNAVPVIACVPVKVIFSRILEAVGRPPSGGIAHWGQPTGLVEKKIS